MALTDGAQPDPAPFRPQLSAGRSRAAVAGVMWSAVHLALPTLVSAVVFFTGAWFLAPAEFGLFGLAAGIVTTVIAISPVGFGEALVQRPSLDPTHVDTVFGLTFGYGLLAWAGLSALAVPLASWMGEPALAAVILVLGVKIPLDLAVAAPSALVVREMQFRALALRTLVSAGIGGSAALAMLFLGHGIWALVASQIIASLIVLAITLRVARWWPSGWPTMRAARALFHYGAFASGGKMLASLRLDHILLGAFGGTALLGLFVLAQRIQQMLTMVLTGALASVSHSLLSSLQSDREKMRRAFFIASFGAAAVGLPVFAGAALVVDDLIRLALSDQWAEAATAAQWFCLLGLLSCIGSVQSSLVKANGRADHWFYYLLIQQVTTLAVIVGTYPMGLDVMIAAIVVKSYLVWPISVWMTGRALKMRPLRYLQSFAAPISATAVMAIAIWAVTDMTLPIGVLLPLQITAGALAYAPTLFLLARGRVTELGTLLRKQKGPET
ncbi:MAG: lipopolysaccharide biosynthesis protein [Pseudomonadota bacterium]